jgi:hypothetical protein
MDNLTLVILLCLFIYLFTTNYKYTGYISESFDSTGRSILPIGYPDYGLRGDRLRWRDIADYYISDHQQVRLNHSGGSIYESSCPPSKLGEIGCGQTLCPYGYDEKDTCWRCSYPRNSFMTGSEYNSDI